MEFCKANDSEVQSILEHAGLSMHEGTLGRMPNDNEVARPIIQPILDRGGIYLIAKEGGEILSWVLLGTTRRDGFSDVQIAFIFDVYTFEQHRRKGLSKKLLELAAQEAKARGFEEIALNVFTGNPARKLYESIGFAENSAVLKMKL